MQRQWKCPTCGAMNVGDGPRCRICRLMPIPPVGAPSPPPPSRAFAPPPPPPAAVPPPSTFLPPPGGGYEPIAPTGSQGVGPPAPEFAPPSAYPAPPPGWYPGAPPPGRTQRRVWPIVVGVVVPVLLLIGLGIVFLRGEDPRAAADRDEADKALLTNRDLGGSFAEVAHRTFARSRGGLRVEGGLAACAPANRELENDGQAVVDSVLQSQNIASAQFVAEEVIVVGAPASATPLVDAMSVTARECANAAAEQGSPGGGLGISLSPSVAPNLGDRAAAFAGSMSVAGGRLAASVEVLIVQQGRAVLFLFTADTTGNLHGDRLATLATTVLMRLAPRFGT